MKNKTVLTVEADEPTKRLAVLIDADNIQSAVFDGILQEVARYGEAMVRRIYGDFTSPTNASWKSVINQFSIKPVQQFAYTKGKNATDSTMIIDAMDLLYTRRFDGFCLVTSDSDFTGLAVRLREEGLSVFGFGEKKTPEAFRNVCHKFIFTEDLRNEVPTASSGVDESSCISDEQAKPSEDIQGDKSESTADQIVSYGFLAMLFLEALEKSTDDTGWANFSTFSSNLRKIYPSFESKHYGYKKLSDLVVSMAGIFEVSQREVPGSMNKTLYVKSNL